MWDSVRSNFYGFSQPLEASIAWMYCDTLGKVTTGVGNLIDSPQAAVDVRNYGAQWFHNEAPGVPLTRPVADAEIRAEWQKVKDSRLGAAATKGMTDLRLTEEGISNLVSGRLGETERYLTNGHVAAFANFATWPADAQLGLLSMAWAMGAAFADHDKWPSFRASCTSEDWLAAARNCNMANDWLIKRNAVNRGLFRNAAYSAHPPPDDPSTLFLPIPGSRPVLKLGDQDEAGSDDVATLQSFLGWLGYAVTETGTFDQDTDTAVRAFQTDERALPNGGNFGIDGKVGQLTWAALGYLVPT